MRPQMAAVSFALVMGALFSQLHAQTPSKPIYNSEPEKLALTPQEAVSKWTLPEGFQVQLFAHEPQVQNPIAMAWDHRGRMWVAENYTYAERQLRFDRELSDRILILEDTNSDGVADSRKVFVDDAKILTSIELGHGGVWMMAPPQLLFIPDRNGDDLPDASPQVILDGFDIGDASHHNFANGLRWGPDGWLYGRCGHSCPGNVGLPGSSDKMRKPIKGGIWRYHPVRQTFEVLAHGTTNPWGHDWDEHGEGFFINTVNGHLWHLIPGAHFKESFGTPLNSGVYDRIDTHADHWHFDTKSSWQKSRDGGANDFGGGHAHIGMMIYQADQWPEEYRNKLFTCNFHGRTINVEHLERSGSGYVGRHCPNLMTAGDPWFRGMEISTGPDGAAYVLDWSDTGECHESTGVHRTSGRIYRVSYGETSSNKSSITSHTPWPLEQSEFFLKNKNGWYERQFRMQLTSQSEPEKLRVAMAFRKMLAEETNVVHQLRALWSLVAIDSCERADLLPLLSHSDEHLRTWGIRLLTDAWPIDNADGNRMGEEATDEELFNRFDSMAANETSGLVRLALASTLQRLPYARRASLANALLRHHDDAEDHNLPFLVWYGLIPLAKQLHPDLEKSVVVCRWPSVQRWMARCFAEQTHGDATKLDRFLQRLANENPQALPAIVAGLDEGWRGSQRVKPPTSWPMVKSILLKSSDRVDETTQATLTNLDVLFGDGRAMESIVKTANDSKADVGLRMAALRSMIDAKPKELRKTCEALLDTRTLNVVALKGLALFDDPKVGELLAKKYDRFLPHERSLVLDTLASRPVWSGLLLDQIALGKIERQELSALHARQIKSFGDTALNEKLKQVWGELRDSSGDHQLRIQELKKKLTPEYLKGANLSAGKVIFQKTCANCHILYDLGKPLGPNLTGSGRANLDYLLENIVDPSAVVGADYRISTIATEDGRVLAGIVVKETEMALTIRLATEEVTLPKSEIVGRSLTTKSMMPDNLIDTLTNDQVRDLFSYLMHPVQVP